MRTSFILAYACIGATLDITLWPFKYFSVRVIKIHTALLDLNLSDKLLKQSIILVEFIYQIEHKNIFEIFVNLLRSIQLSLCKCLRTNLRNEIQEFVLHFTDNAYSSSTIYS